MDALLSVNWMSFFVLAIALCLFKFMKWCESKISWTLVMCMGLVLGAIIGIVFQSPSNSYLVWLDLLGQVYVKLITALVAPVILVCIISGLITLNDKEKMKKIGSKSIMWLLISSACAIVLTLIVGFATQIGAGAGAAFSGLSDVTSNELSAYSEYGKSLDQILLNLIPENVLGALTGDNIVGIIIIGVAIAVAYVSISQNAGEEKVSIVKKLVDATKEIVFYVLKLVIKTTPYAVLCLMAVSASKLLGDADALVQLVLLIAMIFILCIVQCYGVNAILLAVFAKLNPLRFFRKTADAQVTAFTTSSSVGTLPITVDRLINRVGIDEEIANFTAPLGTTMGMAGCTCIWPILLCMFYLNATGQVWAPGQYLIMAVMCLVLSLGSAGMPGVGVITAVSMFSAVNLPIAAVILMMPINNITDMIRTMTNVTDASVCAAIVARENNLIDDEVFNSDVDKSDEKFDAKKVVA